MNSQETHEDIIRKNIVLFALNRIGSVQNVTLMELREMLDLDNQVTLDQFERTVAALQTDRSIRAPLTQRETTLEPKRFLFVEPLMAATALI